MQRMAKTAIPKSRNTKPRTHFITTNNTKFFHMTFLFVSKRGLSFRFICFFTAAILSSMPISPSRQRKFGGHATKMSAVAAAVPKAGAKIQNKINIPKKKSKNPAATRTAGQ
jgi:hypothetical protein